MRLALLVGLLACCAAALARQPDPDDDRGVPGEAESSAVRGAATDAGKDAATGTGQEDAAETDPGGPAGEAAGEPEGEFRPNEEISEDYPVPLPSDI